MVEPEESAYRISTTALALVIGVWGLERPENDPVDHFQRKAGRQALGKQPTSFLQNVLTLQVCRYAKCDTFALLAAIIPKSKTTVILIK